MDLLRIPGESLIRDTTSVDFKFCWNEHRLNLFIIFNHLIVMRRLLRTDLYVSAMCSAGFLLGPFRLLKTKGKMLDQIEDRFSG